METYVLLLIVVPIIFAILFALGKGQNYYKMLSFLLFGFGTILSVLLALKGPQIIPVEGTTLKFFETVVSVCEIFIILFLYYVSIKHKRWPVLALTIIQTIITIYAKLNVPAVEGAAFNVDKLSIVMALIVNIIGTLIVVFSNDYIVQYEHHRHLKNKQKLYYFVICIFLSAMNGLVLSDSLEWVYFFWEITTLASFILISYNRDEEAYNSGFRALFLNIIGGMAFSIGNIILAKQYEIGTLSEVLKHGKGVGLYLLPIFLLCIAGFVKSAQVPFQSWLLGAMVAPTPISALLHSSTMVKAGVFLVIKLSPAYAGTWLGTSIALFAGFTFMICSLIAISQRNAKRVLAYSTIANLGLIICCAGMGTSVAISGAILLLIFHAISKALMFLCAGQIEHTIGSRDIEDMQGLIRTAPFLTGITVLGMLSMLLPPFGVLITKWLAIEAASSNPILAILLVLGSAFTTVFWVKWLAGILGYPVESIEKQKDKELTTYFPLVTLSALIVVVTAFMTPIVNHLVTPEVKTLLNINNELLSNRADISSPIGSFENIFVYVILISLLVIALILKGKLFAPKIRGVYMCGENNTENQVVEFRNGDGSIDTAVVSNLYLTKVIDEQKFTKMGYIVSIAIIAVVLIMCAL